MMRNEDQKIVEFENDPVSKLLGGLKRVEAPGDFDFRVKARIASGRPVDRSASWLPTAARLAVPLGLLLVIGGYFGYSTNYSTDNLAVAPVVQMQGSVPVPELNPPVLAATPAKDMIAKRIETKPAISESSPNLKPAEKKIARSVPDTRSVGGSYEETRRISTPLRPKGFDKNASVSARDILSFIGVDADPSGKIGSVKQNSMADRSGLKAGDVIEAINDQNLAERSTFGNKVSGRTIRVRRGDKTVQIALKP